MCSVSMGRKLRGRCQAARAKIFIKSLAASSSAPCCYSARFISHVLVWPGRQGALALALSPYVVATVRRTHLFRPATQLLNIGRQRIFFTRCPATFVALLYLALVRRISEWFAQSCPGSDRGCSPVSSRRFQLNRCSVCLAGGCRRPRSVN